MAKVPWDLDLRLVKLCATPLCHVSVLSFMMLNLEISSFCSQVVKCWESCALITRCHFSSCCMKFLSELCDDQVMVCRSNLCHASFCSTRAMLRIIRNFCKAWQSL